MAAEPDISARLDAAFGDQPPDHIAVALSGGPDSTALLHLTLSWAQRHGVQVSTLTVDHGLRPDSAMEAADVAERARALGAVPQVLNWHHQNPETGIQNAAREARYTLMVDWCRSRQVPALLLAHHLDDQAATVLMRLQRGSGLDGLGGMQADSLRDGVRLLRPLLDHRKQALIDWLDARGHAFVTDPSNASPKYERNRLNSLLAAHDVDGLLAGRLETFARRSQRASRALNEMTDRIWQDHVAATSDSVTIAHSIWTAQSAEIRLRLLIRMIEALTGTTPNLGKAEDALGRLTLQRRVTLGGAMLSLTETRLKAERAPPRT